MKKIISILLLIPLSFVSMTPAFAAFFENGDILSLSIPYGDDLYAAGGQVLIDGDVNGDAMIAGGMVNLKGNVSGDVSVGGGSLTINGNIGDDMRAAGGNIIINSIVGDDLFVAGGNITLTKDAVVKGDLILGGGQVNLNGSVLGNVKMGSGILNLEGTITGEAKIYGGSIFINNSIGKNVVLSADDVRFGPNARLGGDLRYWQKKGELDLSQSSIQGKVTFDPALSTIKNKVEFGREQVSKSIGSIFLGFLGYYFLSSVLIILVLFLVTKKFFQNSAIVLQKKPLMSFLAGLGFFVLTPILIFLLFLTLIGIPLAGFVFVIYVLSFCLASILSSLVLGHWVVWYWSIKGDSKVNFFICVLVYLALSLLWVIPFVGWLINMVLVVMAFGAYLIQKKEAWKKVA